MSEEPDFSHPPFPYQQSAELEERWRTGQLLSLLEQEEREREQESQG